MIIKELKTIEDFKALKKGDVLVCEFHRDIIINNKRFRFKSFEVFLNKEEASEIILERKNNIYFNYAMFCSPDESSNLKSVILVSPEPTN